MEPPRLLLSPAGQTALAALMRSRPLLAFDFDGTLAPIVARPDDAGVPAAVARRLARLAAALPVAIVTGRTVRDVAPRLAFVPWAIVGNHGAEDGRVPLAPAPALQPLRQRLAEAQRALEAIGVQAEDKGLSIALHYRLARDRALARRRIDALLEPFTGGALAVFGGKMVVNVMPAGAPDKADAVLALAGRSGADAVFFAGDDVNDEPVFAAAPPHWLTLRVGHDAGGTAARYVLDSPADMALLLDQMIRLANL